MAAPLQTPRRGAHVIVALSAATLAAALAGCVVAPAYPGRPVYADEGAVLVAPPPAQYELIGVAPYPGWFWIAGYWTWRVNRHVWIGGHWEAPRPGYHWQPHRWEPVMGGRGWRESPGRWNR